LSKYTTELKNILDSGFDLGMKDYPVISEEYRTKLNAKIFNHYMFNEIGFETVSVFKHYLNTTMDEIMPYYNQLLQSELLVMNPLLSFERKVNSEKDTGSTVTKNSESTTNQSLDNTTTIDNTTTANTDESTTTGVDTTQDTTNHLVKNNVVNDIGNGKDIFSDTPQALLTNTNIDTNYYATNATVKSNVDLVTTDETHTLTDGIVKNEDSTVIVDGTVVNVSDTMSTAFTTNGSASNCTADATNDKITITKTGHYLVNCPVSFSGQSPNVNWKMAAFWNNTEQPQIHVQRKIGTGGDVGSTTCTGIVNVTSVPTDLDIRFRHDQAGSENITVVYSNLTATYIGE